MTDLETVFRAEHGRVVASLARRFGDLDLAEDATGEALVVAAERWPVEGMPPNPGGWLTTVAGNKALDRLRRESRGREKLAEVARMTESRGHGRRPCRSHRTGRGRPAAAGLHLLPPGTRAGEPGGPDAAPARRADRGRDRRGLPGAGDDDGAADHPLEAEDQGGAASPTGSRAPRTCPARMSAVLAVLYLVFNEGYLGSSGEAQRTDLTAEAIRLARQLREMVAGDAGARPPARGRRAAGADAAHRVTLPCPGPRRRAGAARPAGPLAAGTRT